ncbi:MAG: terminase [Bacteroidetes bacterium]|nr:terminase [Bacteroidota bacterium]
MASKIDIELAHEVAKYYADPLGFVMFAYPWDTDPSIQVCELPEPWASKYNSKYGPDEWSCQFLDDLGEKIKANKFDGSHAVDAIRMAVSSGHGIGKSAMTGWLVNLIMSTRPNAQGTVTANTGPQLESKTWPQIAKWTKRCITSHWFDISSGRGSMRMRHKLFPESWFCTAQTCREENSEAFAGQHAVDSTSFYINDESSAISDKIFEVQDGGMTDGEPMQFLFGNPTKNTGSFREAFGKKRHRFMCYQVDSRDVQITNKKYIDELIADNGEDSDYTRVRVKGVFPRASSAQLIPYDLVEAARGKIIHVSEYAHAPRILICDPARFGDDQSTIGERQGLRHTILHKYRGKDTMFLANKLGTMNNDEGYDAVFIDVIGVGAGVVDRLIQLGHRNIIPVNFAESAKNEKKYHNLRAECWAEIIEWLKAGGCIDDDQEVCDDLVGPEYFYDARDRMQLESKKDMRARGLNSPDCGDNVAISFARPVSKIVHLHEPTASCKIARIRRQTRKQAHKVFSHIGGR